MKHPGLGVLQDYYENTLNSFQEELVKEHLLNCDQCTQVLSDFTVIEKRVMRAPSQAVSEATRDRIFQNAQILLKARQNQGQMIEERAKAKKLRRQRREALLQDWKENLLPELKIPALQICSLTAVLAVIIAIESSSSEVIQTIKPLSTQVEVFTNPDFDNLQEKP